MKNQDPFDFLIIILIIFHLGFLITIHSKAWIRMFLKPLPMFLINSKNIVDIYKLGITQESELMDSIVSIKEKNLEELYNEIDKRAKDEKAGHIRDALIGLKNRIRILQTGFSLKTNIDFNRIINKNSIIDLSGISNEDIKNNYRRINIKKNFKMYNI